MRTSKRGIQPPPIERVIRPFQEFARHKLSGAGLLLVATAGALIWANSPWKEAYHHILETEISLHVARWSISNHLLHWINDGLMGVFFFVVGLEIKREIIAGELSEPRKAALPIAGALGGMLVPAAVYLVFNVGGEGEQGWGIPMATDIAFALGVLAILGNRVPLGLKVFLTALAIVDDIGAILVIAVFYTDHIVLTSLLAGGGIIALSIGANVAGVRNPIVYFVLGTLVWLAFLNSGIHATLAAVLMAFTIPARVRIRGVRFRARVKELLLHLKDVKGTESRRLLTPEHLHVLHEMERTLEKATPPLQDLEHTLAPMVTFLVLPLFALANAGVTIGGGMEETARSPVAWGIVAGLFLGKQLGITLFSLLAVKVGLADLPSGVRWSQLHAVSVLGGIGFTMSLFVGSLAFTDPEVVNSSKIAILLASLLSGVLGGLLLVSSSRRKAPDGARTETGPADPS